MATPRATFGVSQGTRTSERANDDERRTGGSTDRGDDAGRTSRARAHRRQRRSQARRRRERHRDGERATGGGGARANLNVAGGPETAPRVFITRVLALADARARTTPPPRHDTHIARARRRQGSRVGRPQPLPPARAREREATRDGLGRGAVVRETGRGGRARVAPGPGFVRPGRSIESRARARERERHRLRP